MSRSPLNKYALLLSFAFSTVGVCADYEWNYPAPVKTPSAATNNGKTVFFDVSHGGTEGNADWVINGGFSDFADSLVNQGYTVKEYRGVDKNNDGIIQFVNDYTSPSASASAANEAVITYAAISQADVLVLAESNRPFTLDEQTALEQFIAAGKGIYFIGDHYNADRNLNTWDATEVFNGYNRSNLAKYNLGSSYGDLRNPANANAGWLVNTFGIRFRFNAINLLAGASAIAAQNQSEGITAGVAPVLMAAGATLAIVDPSRAKGLVYFSNSDNPSKWGSAVDSGLYFGGATEGAYVAIAKSGAGKAAFIGDSSPIEDSTPRYRRQDSGGSKSTYPGWTDTGNAAQLSINIINWLATPESYTQFNSTTHPAGIATPYPIATQELTDPDNGQPWSSPSGGYNPWNPATFAKGAYGAPLAVNGSAASSSQANSSINVSSSSISSGSNSGAINVSVALTKSIGTAVVVQGVVTQAINGIYALEMADTQNPSTTIFVKLESQYRAQFSPQNNPALIGKTIKVTGIRDNYLNNPSIEYVTGMIEVSATSSNSFSSSISSSSSSTSSTASCYSNNRVSVTTAYSAAVNTHLVVAGRVVAAVNGQYALELADLTNSTTIYVKLESNQRAYFSPANNPSMINKILEITGTRDNYLSYPSLESVANLQELSNCQ